MRLNPLKQSQIVTVGASEVNHALTTLSSKHSYMCANAQITRGFTHAPYTIEDCLGRFPQIKEVAKSLGVSGGASFWIAPDAIFGSTGSTAFAFYDLLTGITSQECLKIGSTAYDLGTAWMGCLWGSPMASFSCTCPDIGPQFLDYLKLRLNVATFWNTPAIVPPQRAEFIDCVENSERVTILVPGDFSVTPGEVVELKVDNMASYSTEIYPSILSKFYYVLSVKHTIQNSGVHETQLVLSDLRPIEYKKPNPPSP
jgi:hypothetical protein